MPKVVDFINKNSWVWWRWCCSTCWPDCQQFRPTWWSDGPHSSRGDTIIACLIIIIIFSLLLTVQWRIFRMLSRTASSEISACLFCSFILEAIGKKWTCSRNYFIDVDIVGCSDWHLQKGDISSKLEFYRTHTLCMAYYWVVSVYCAVFTALPYIDGFHNLTLWMARQRIYHQWVIRIVRGLLLAPC